MTIEFFSTDFSLHTWLEAIFKDEPLEIRPSRGWPIIELVGRRQIVERVQNALEQQKLQLEKIENNKNMLGSQRRAKDTQSPLSQESNTGIDDEDGDVSSIIELQQHHIIFLKYYEHYLEVSMILILWY